jgi:hypothetical protein
MGTFIQNIKKLKIDAPNVHAHSTVYVHVYVKTACKCHCPSCMLMSILYIRVSMMHAHAA